jgi:FtsH-binding integral membrane protein
MEHEAISLAHMGVLGNPYAVPTGPSAHVNPAYPMLLALIFYMFGTAVLGESVKVAVTCLITSTQYALFPALGRALGLPGAFAFAAGVFGALVPLNPYLETRGDFENHVDALLLLLLIIWTTRLSKVVSTPREAVGFGIFCGFSVLTSSGLLPLDFLAIGYMAYRQTRLPGGRPTAALISALMVVLCLAPWAIRNDIQLGAPIYTRSNFGLEFFLGNNDQSSPLVLKNVALVYCCHPLVNAGEAEKVRQFGEVEYNKRLLARAKAWVRSHPRRFGQLTLERIWYTWMPYTPEPSREALFLFMTPLSLTGLFVIARIRRESAMLLGAILFVFPLPMYLTQVHVRYRYPVQFIMLLTASAAVFSGLIWVRQKMRFAPDEQAHQYTG